MDELKACPFCGSSNTTLDYYEISCPQELGTIVVCNDCGASAKSIVDWNTRPIEDTLRAELARRTASLHYANTVCMEQKHVIDRLKEDAERLASNYVIEAFPHEWVCRGGCHHWARFGEQIDHAPDCPITLHRALMKELE